MRSGHWSALRREQIMRETAARDGEEVRVWLEQEPGSGGKESAEASIRNLAGYVVHADRVTGEKVARAQPLAAQCEAGNVRIVRGAWNHDYLEELCSFPLATLKDQVDASTGAFNKLSRGGAAEWTPEEIARVGRRWRGEEAGSGETHLEYYRRLRQEREVQDSATADLAETTRTQKELAAQKRRAYEQEVEEANRVALLRARGGQ
jgi:predicted phage terminase large subunit-like protein